MADALIPPERVSTRADLEEYLGQALLDEYYFREEGKIVRQVSTFLKTYLIEFHQRRVSTAEPSHELIGETLLGMGFSSVAPTQEPSLWRVSDNKGLVYFVDALDRRFPLIHTIEHTKYADSTIQQVTSADRGADRCWLPSRFLVGSDLGHAIGFRLFYQHGLEGLPQSDEARQLANELGRDRPPPVRMHLTNVIGAADDLQALRRATRFGGSSSIDSMEWRDVGEDWGSFIHDEVWHHGKMSARGTSWERHLSHALALRERYSTVIQRLEDDYAIRVSNGFLVGEPVSIKLPGATVADVGRLAESIADPAGPVRVWGVVTKRSNELRVIDAIDIHTGHRLALEISPEFVHVYLRTETCGNVLLRLLVHPERHVAAQLETSIDYLLSSQVSPVS